MKKVAVVGGGITGLAAAFRLRQTGLDPLIYEAGQRAGGAIETREIGDFRVDSGPTGFLERSAEVGDLIRALQLEQEIVEANPDAAVGYVAQEGQLLPAPMLRTAELVYGSRPPAARATMDKPGNAQLISFRRGMGTLTDTLVKQLKRRIYFETTVESLKEMDGKWELVASRYGRRLRDRYDAVVLALPARAFAAIRFERNEKPVPLEFLDALPNPPAGSVSFGFKREQVRHSLNGFGLLVPENERRRIFGTLFASTLFPERAPDGHALLTTFAGGTRRPDLAEIADEELGALVLEELRSLLGITGAPVMTSIHRWAHAIPPEGGDERFLQALRGFEAGCPRLFVGGPIRDGILIGQRIASGFRHAGRVKEFIA